MKKAITFLMLLALAAGIQAQSVERWVIGSAGGSYYDAVHDFEMDFTVGEVAITTISNVNNVLTQGFQQPFTLAWVSVEEVSDNPAQIILYPNPVMDQLNLSISNAQSGTYRIMVFDMLGQLVIDENVSTGFDGTATFNCNFNSFATGNYFVRIQHEKKILETCKIVKISQ